MRPRLLFVSPRFLFPIDSGGKIRTTQILRGLRGGAFEIVLASPAPAGARDRWGAELAGVCDRFESWDEPPRRGTLRRALGVLGREPLAVASDRSAEGSRRIAALLAESPAATVFDFPHAAVLAPPRLRVPSVLFTHNVEAEIYRRHASVAADPLRRAVWAAQFRKMQAFEGETLRRFDRVIAVSQRDADAFRAAHGVAAVDVISTGVDLDYFGFEPPVPGERCVFMGSMDWPANIDAMEFFMDAVWPRVVERRPGATMLVVGRTPPESLVARARERGLAWEFTGFVDDVRPWVRTSAVSVIPLRVGGGTRLKAYEAMALGRPVVSTTIGVEGLPLVDGRHYRNADAAEDFANAVVELLADSARASAIAVAAREFVADNFSHRTVARQFETICLDAAGLRSAA